MTQKLSEKEYGVTRRQDSQAVAIARAHIRAWSNHDFETARKYLAEDVHVTVSTTQPIMSATDTTGVGLYMEGLQKFVQPIEQGSARVTESIGDDHNALLMVTVKGKFAPDVAPVTLTGARLYLIDEKNKIKSEKVIFCVLEN